MAKESAGAGEPASNGSNVGKGTDNGKWGGPATQGSSKSKSGGSGHMSQGKRGK